MYLNKYIEKNGRESNYDVFNQGGYLIRSIPTEDILLSQYENDIYNAVDIIVKLLAIENYYGLNDYGFKLYQKMQKNRIGENWNDRFIDLIRNVDKYGLKNDSTLETDIKYSIHDGAHRVALALFHEINDLNVKVYDVDISRRKYGIDWFSTNGFTKEELNLIQSKLNEILNKKNPPYYCILWPPARHIFDKITGEIERVEKGISIVDSTEFALDREIFKKFMYDVYNTDDIAPFKLDLKYKYLMESLDKDNFNDSKLPFVVVKTKLDNPDFKMKGLTGLPQSKKTMRIKKQIRKDNSELITDYYYDIIMHMTDNTIQNRDLEKILKKVK